MKTDVQNDTYTLATTYRGWMKAEIRLYCIIYGWFLWPLLLTEIRCSSIEIRVSKIMTNINQSDVVTGPFSTHPGSSYGNLFARHAFNLDTFPYVSLVYFIVIVMFRRIIDIDKQINIYELVICRHDSNITLYHQYPTRFINAVLDSLRQIQEWIQNVENTFTCRRHLGLSYSESIDLTSDFKCKAPANKHSYLTNALVCRCSLCLPLFSSFV